MGARQVEIDDRSGFCFGVVRAIRMAEECLSDRRPPMRRAEALRGRLADESQSDSDSSLISLGDIVHNDAEVARLRALGLETVSEHADIQSLAGHTVLVRAHGEPPSTYRAAETAGVRLVDATCPVVSALQKTVAAAFRRMSDVNGQVVIFGRRGHAEVRGLVGQCRPPSAGSRQSSAAPSGRKLPRSERIAELGEAGIMVIESAADLGNIDFARPIYFLAQTTSSLGEFRALAAEIERRAEGAVTVHDTICRQVADREAHLAEFARLHDVVIFVAGAKSSNGKVLFEAVRRANASSYKIEDISELRPEWFAQTQLSPKLSVGVCGATSTPRWLMERVARAIEVPRSCEAVAVSPSCEAALLERFLRYVGLDTQSDPASSSTPSTPGQLVMLQLLADELREMGAEDIELKNGACLTATIPASSTSTGGRQRPPCGVGGAEQTGLPAACERSSAKSTPVIGFLAHVDTSPDAPGANVKPCVKGDWITSDSSTLLGADNKAGVAIIMTAAEILLSRAKKSSSQPLPAFRQHGKIRLAFTTDEEIGRGVDLFDIQHFGADFAYTVDGGELGELEYENFNAAQARVTIHGRSAHPGDAKGKMISALRVASEIDAALPSDQRPETTSGREGFYHLTRLSGTVENAEMEYLIRDFDSAGFAARKQFLTDTVARFEGTRIALTDQYFNMREVVERHPEVIRRAERAMRSAGVEPLVRAIRGGTDGARLSFAGLPCPNVFTGGENFHSLSERVSISAMVKAVEVVVGIADLRI